MAIITCSLKKDRGKKLSANFTVAEFACKDGSDSVLIDEDLVALLQKIRDHFGKPVTITSAYRTAAHNKAVGGASNSQHLYGRAADISVSGVTPLAVAQYAESLLTAGGIGHYPAGQGSFTHVDTSAVKSRWEKRSGREISVSGFGGQVPAPTPKPVNITMEPKTILVNGKPKQIRAGLIDGEDYVHMRDLVAAMGGTVGYDAASKQVAITRYIS